MSQEAGHTFLPQCIRNFHRTRTSQAFLVLVRAIPGGRGLLTQNCGSSSMLFVPFPYFCGGVQLQVMSAHKRLTIMLFSVVGSSSPNL